MKSSEEEDINEVLKGVAEKEIMLKKLTDTMVKQFLKTGDRGDEDDEDQERERKEEKKRTRTRTTVTSKVLLEKKER